MINPPACRCGCRRGKRSRPADRTGGRAKHPSGSTRWRSTGASSGEPPKKSTRSARGALRVVGVNDTRLLVCVQRMVGEAGGRGEGRSCIFCVGSVRGCVRNPASLAQNRVQGHPGGECRGACVVFLAHLPAGGLAVERCLKECVSKRGQRVVCPSPNPRGLRSQRCGWRSPQHSYHKADVRSVPWFLMKALSGGRGGAPLTPAAVARWV